MNFEKIEDLLKFLEDSFEGDFVHGRGNRKTQKQRDIEILRERVSRKNKYENQQNTFKGRNSYSKTDEDATFMRMKEDHMLNGQLKPGYNLQLGVEAEYITGIQISSERSDQLTLIPLLNKMEEKLGEQYNDVTADAGYESEEAYTYLEEQGQETYIKPSTYERWKKQSFKKDISKRENMAYDQETDKYTCHNGKELSSIHVKKQRSKNGYVSDVTVYECEDCSECPYMDKCKKSKNNKRLYVSKKFVAQREKSQENITSEQGILYRMNRSIQVEGAFGVLKNDYNFQKFLLRGKTKVKLEILLLCLGYNINKLHGKIQNERTQSYLFPIKSA